MVFYYSTKLIFLTIQTSFSITFFWKIIFFPYYDIICWCAGWCSISPCLIPCSEVAGTASERITPILPNKMFTVQLSLRVRQILPNKMSPDAALVTSGKTNPAEQNVYRPAAGEKILCTTGKNPLINLEVLHNLLNFGSTKHTCIWKN
mgnify:CR=1 FL=1